MTTARRPQLSFEDLGTPLAEADLVVVDLETTGTDPQADAITEIGAVRVRGGEVIGEFRTFVDPQRPIPAYIALLTGISDATVRDAPRIDVALPMFLDFARGAAFVAHNARFDMGFLRAAAARLDEPWPRAEVIDTLALARRAFPRGEVRDHRLGTLAAHVGATTSPEHRALADARATVDVLHALIERLGPAAATVEDLASAHRRVAPVQLRKKHLAASVPSAPGVYQFLDAGGSVLYVGTSRDLRSRVRTYFTAAETRRKVLDMLPRAEEIRTIVCETATEAAVRELRIIAEEQPPANRHGLRPEKALWLRLGPRGEGLRAVRLARDESDGSAHIGPLRSRHEVEPLRGLLMDAVLADRARAGGDHRQALRRIMVEDPTPLLRTSASRLRALAEAGRYEDASALRDRVEMFLRAAHRASRLRALAAVPLLVAARPARLIGGLPGWELLAIRHGLFAGTHVVHRTADPVAAARALARESEASAAAPAPLCQGHHQESEILLEWLGSEGVRLVVVDGEWAVPRHAQFTVEALQRAYERGQGPWERGQ
ncbi:DEDD exonuclease domain-containing protein [Brachybacterium sp. EF45031]|uniref:DEDD exonuclease domain-containing protein n=1 Tax=Brachybacterium sillae TaxID=2810536 RepID=UPI00217EA0DD|nr:DEDD exonuclease domain-containing protein [Brachybacterium sillae]MCS6710487.1 DEDD exonuclease domain-containing protein [Brachybacterium sillae]